MWHYFIYYRTNKEFFRLSFQFIERVISKDRYFHTWIIIEDTWWKTLSWGYKNESWRFHGLQPIFYLFYKIPGSVSISGTHVFIAETCNKNIILLQLKYHIKGQTTSGKPVKSAKNADYKSRF